MTRILGLDFGTRRVGIAISDPGRTMAFPVERLRTSRARARRTLLSASSSARTRSSASSSVSRCTPAAGKVTSPRVLAGSANGWPRRPADRSSTSTSATRRSKPSRALLDAGLTRKKRKARRDKLAAQIMLQGYLDAGCPEKEAAAAPLSDQDAKPIVTTLIIGCGYLGERLGGLLSRAGERVCGTVRSQARAAEIARQGIEPLIADVLDPLRCAACPPPIASSIASASTVPPELRCDRFMSTDSATSSTVCRESLPRIVYASSTGVYGQTEGEWVDEQTPPSPRTESGRICLEAEERS